MFKSLMLFSVMVFMVGCGDKAAAKKAYAAGCADGINIVIDSMGGSADPAKVAPFCDKAADEYLKKK